ncbi:MAG: phosphonoacetate hydrolase [Rhodothermales bacterium]
MTDTTAMRHAIATEPFTCNNRTYHPPARPVVVICLDGCADEYLDVSLVRGRMPRLHAVLAGGGYRGRVRGALPSFTNVNNASIVTGTPPSEHGISGNFFLDPETGEEVMMNAATYLRTETILAKAAQAGRKVAMVTAKEKLRDLLSHDLSGIAFSAEKADQAREDTHGITDVPALVGEETPPIYSAEASLFVLKAGVALIEQGRADLLYLSLTDYMQHKYPPERPESLDFYEALDRELGRMLDLGAVMGATADHGMNAKQQADGTPNVIYLERLLRKEFGNELRVILPITDPYVLHHGSLGSFAVVHLQNGAAADEVARRLIEMEGITEVYDRPTAARKLELPQDRIGDLVVLSGRDVVLGRTPEDHDLSNVQTGLRSHGGRYEEMVPLLLSEPLTSEYMRKASADPRNFDVFDFTINGVQE